jgi:hypothetical protein
MVKLFKTIVAFCFTAIALLFIINNIGARSPIINCNNAAYVYPAGTAITALTPTNAGGAVPATIYRTVTTSKKSEEWKIN